jgi:energy-coupling factor transport system ATP-binding protein
MEHVGFTYPGTRNKSLQGVSFHVREGECVLITGRSGCGKTTLTRVMNGLCPKFYGGTLGGKYFLDGKSIGEISLDAIGLTLGSVFQDPRSQFFSKRVRDEISLAMENHCVPRELMHEKLWDISELLGITHLHGREMRTLSSGEKQKVAIASVCAMSPKGLVLDEPSANLDTNAIVQLAEFLKSIKAQGHAIIISEHRLHYLRDIFDRLAVMENGSIAREYNRAEALALSPTELQRMGLRLFDVPTCQVEQRVSDYSGSVMRVDHIGLRAGDQQILQDVSIGANIGEITAITGSNGAGKTSLLRVMTGLQKESAGAVYLKEAFVRRKKRIKSTFFVQQDVDYQLYTPSVHEEIRMGSGLSKDDAHVLEVSEALGLTALLNRHPNTLSGGQKQRVLIAAAVLRDAPVMVLDEPTSGLDGYHMRAVSEILKNIARRGKAVMLATHDLEFISGVADSLAYMHMRELKYHNRLVKAEPRMSFLPP